jgi:hypothetical protein
MLELKEHTGEGVLTDEQIESTDLLMAIERAGGVVIGYVGIRWTNIVAREAFIYYIPVEKPSIDELRIFRLGLRQWQKDESARLWMTTEPDRPDLERWARFMKFSECGSLEGHTMWRRS